MQKDLFKSRPIEMHHVWNPTSKTWHLSAQGMKRLKQENPPRVRWSHDSAIWYDLDTGEVHSPFRARYL